MSDYSKLPRIVEGMDSSVQGEGLDLVLSHMARLGLHARSDVGLEEPVLPFYRPHLHTAPSQPLVNNTHPTANEGQSDTRLIETCK